MVGSESLPFFGHFQHDAAFSLVDGGVRLGRNTELTIIARRETRGECTGSRGGRKHSQWWELELVGREAPGVKGLVGGESFRRQGMHGKGEGRDQRASVGGHTSSSEAWS